jgi:hypothetical protein
MDPCGNASKGQSIAPGGGMKAVVFARDCGATTGFATHVSVMRSSEDLVESANWIGASRGGNAFIADTNHGLAPSESWGGARVRVKWTGPTQLRIEHDRGARIFKARSRIRGIDIEYGEIPPAGPTPPSGAAGK